MTPAADAPIVQVGSPVIRQVSELIEQAQVTSNDIQDIIATLHKKLQEIGGVGLAAPQIGSNKRIFVVHIGPTKFRPHITKIESYAVVNPQILEYSDTVESDYEGCFSVAEANLFAKVSRSISIVVTYTDAQGGSVKKELSGLEARVFQHEYDHLDGQVFLDRETDMKTIMSASEYKKIHKN